MAERNLRTGLRAFGLYLLLSIATVDHGASITRSVSGAGTDPFIFIWFFAWWPYALAHHLDLFHLDLLWHPLGLPTFWVTSIPLLGLALAPLTGLAGPVVTYNLATIAAPALSAWAAYRLYARYVGDETAALIGGYLFGFSTYEVLQDERALNLSVAVCLPWLLMVILGRLTGRHGRAAFVWRASALLTAQFLLSQEIAALALMVGGLAWVLALVYAPAYRQALKRLVIDGLAVGVVMLLALSPILLSMVRHRNALHLPAIWPWFFTADLADFLLPSPTNLWGWLLRSRVDTHSLSEAYAYIGVPWFVMVVAFTKGAFTKDTLAPALPRYMMVMLGILVIASLGPLLWIDGVATPLVFPWVLFVHLPLTRDILPARLAVFITLLAGFMAAFFIAGAGDRRWRVGLGLCACVALAPRPHPWMALPDSAFFAPGRVQSVLGPHPQLLILPFAINGPSSYWQVESRFAFTQTGGYLGFPPGPMQAYPAVRQLFGDYMDPNFPQDFARFAIGTGTDDVIIGAGTKPEMTAALATLHWPTRHVDDVTILTVPHG
jgi:hypothetical protein